MTILQSSIPYDPLSERPLPGIQPASMETWLHRDDAFAAQMQYRAALLRDRRADVLALDPAAEPAAQEVLDLVLHHAYPGCSGTVIRPDGQVVGIDRKHPMETLCNLVQEDICILQKRGEEHVLTGAILCFPASWRLSEKFMRPLIDIHLPVDSYDENVARRVQRLFDGIQPGRPLWRYNALWYEDAELYQPRSAQEPRHIKDPGTAAYLRSERQTLLRLPKSQAVIFSIHTYVLAAERLRKIENPA
ncbi:MULTISPECIES: DUF3445 domain-containing protein [unclassified Ruegeria]|uniref:heme-dependent oxidative N-demethylase family protein n=1 Tax=unclassified Ruegeria TaxID=2625375 RepID=UPI001ADCB964|nr:MULTISPECIES: DUF3445 domain-containing protein [unclassified Ruegeria]MBO9410359.1 DUF3445 domain-containing protein [Ruegeria sp. R8_1]MBO9414422.1 DUF3445 domain-containing protein [Ruegeria sp. R8_2]